MTKVYNYITVIQSVHCKVACKFFSTCFLCCAYCCYKWFVSRYWQWLTGPLQRVLLDDGPGADSSRPPDLSCLMDVVRSLDRKYTAGVLLNMQKYLCGVDTIL